MGTTKVGDFDIREESAAVMLRAVNPHGRPNSDVLRPFRNGSDLVQNDSRRWIVDFGVGTAMETAARYEAPFQYLVEFVKPDREKNNDKWRRKNWWLLGRTLPDFREATTLLPRYIGTARVAKHRLFVWQDTAVLPDSKVIAIGLAGDFHFGVLSSRIHRLWTLATCAWHGIGNDATYNPTECFETFPFPFRDDLLKRPPNVEAELNAAKHYAHIVLRNDPPPVLPGEHRAAIAAAAKELNDLRERWLNPPEWTETRTLEFPGTAGGPWSRYIDPTTVDPQTNIGMVRYPRLEPRDAECAVKLKKRTLTNLYDERPAWLDLAHKKLDAAVAAAYGWPADLSDEQILENLLALNLARAEEEARSSAARKPKAQRAKHGDEIL
jgi:hypothetical protein